MHRAPWLLAAASIGLVAPAALAQPARPARPPRLNEGPSIDFHLNRFQDDFGLGGGITSPGFFKGAMRIGASGGAAWFPRGVVARSETWLPYGHAEIVFEGGQRLPHTPIRLYGFGGPIALFSPRSLSSKWFQMGGFGGFGFECHFQRSPDRDQYMSYFLEAGGIGIGGRADAVPGRPIHANGFLLSTGFRVYLQ